MRFYTKAEDRGWYVVKYREKLDYSLDMDIISDINEILNDIEGRVLDILDSIQGVEGLSEIDNLKEDLGELCKDLY